MFNTEGAVLSWSTLQFDVSAAVDKCDLKGDTACDIDIGVLVVDTEVPQEDSSLIYIQYVTVCCSNSCSSCNFLRWISSCLIFFNATSISASGVFSRLFFYCVGRVVSTLYESPGLFGTAANGSSIVWLPLTVVLLSCCCCRSRMSPRGVVLAVQLIVKSGKCLMLGRY